MMKFSNDNRKQSKFHAIKYSFDRFEHFRPVTSASFIPRFSENDYAANGWIKPNPDVIPIQPRPVSRALPPASNHEMVIGMFFHLPSRVILLFFQVKVDRNFPIDHLLSNILDEIFLLLVHVVHQRQTSPIIVLINRRDDLFRQQKKIAQISFKTVR